MCREHWAIKWGAAPELDGAKSLFEQLLKGVILGTDVKVSRQLLDEKSTGARRAEVSDHGQAKIYTWQSCSMCTCHASGLSLTHPQT